MFGHCTSSSFAECESHPELLSKEFQERFVMFHCLNISMHYSHRFCSSQGRRKPGGGSTVIAVKFFMEERYLQVGMPSFSAYFPEEFSNFRSSQKD